MLEGKTCSLRRAFTTLFARDVTRRTGPDPRMVEEIVTGGWREGRAHDTTARRPLCPLVRLLMP